MKRVELFEFEDFAWFPAWLRSDMTSVLAALNRMLGVHDVVAGHLAGLMEEQGQRTLVDLCSGGGGPMPEVLSILREAPATATTSLLMTDRFPNRNALAKFNAEEGPLTYSPEPLDATELKNAPAGIKTMINCFHHMPPDTARGILASAQRSRSPIFIYEMGENKVPLFLWFLTLPLGLLLVFLSCVVLTLKVRPLTFRQVFFTFFVPLIPAFYAWDGQASMARIYTPDDMRGLLEGLESDDYRWEIGPGIKPGGKTMGNYLLGVPVEAAAADAA